MVQQRVQLNPYQTWYITQISYLQVPNRYSDANEDPLCHCVVFLRYLIHGNWWVNINRCKKLSNIYTGTMQNTY